MSDAYDDGIDDITSTDVDAGVVDTMRQRNGTLRPRLRYMQTDACDMHNILDKSFDIVIDKSVMDALICAGKSVVSRCSREVHRVLTDSGLYLCVSLNDPEQMRVAITRTGCPSRQWQVKVLSCDNGHSETESNYQTIYMYVCRKVQVKLR
jgi:ubiquinone/menaquinone biosynthesis C-methylase UbiE